MATTQTKRGNGRAPSKRGNDGRFVAKYSRRLGVEICRRVASGKSLSEVCRDQHMPHRDTVQTWLANPKYDELRREYDRAIQLRADRIFDELLQIADDARNDWMERQRQDGSTEIKFDKENVQRSRLRIDTRKWVLGRMNPQKYGDRVTSHITADPPPGSREGDSPRERVLKKLADMRRRSDQVSLGFAAAGDLGLPESIANDRRLRREFNPARAAEAEAAEEAARQQFRATAIEQGSVLANKNDFRSIGVDGAPQRQQPRGTMARPEHVGAPVSGGVIKAFGAGIREA